MERVHYAGPRFRLGQMKTDVSWLTFPKYGHCWLPVPPPPQLSLPALPMLPGLSCSEQVAACSALTLEPRCVYTCIHL